MCGVKDTRLQHRLLAEPGLTFQKAFELAQSSEVAEQMQRTFKDRRLHSNRYTKLDQRGPLSHHLHATATDAEDLMYQNHVVSRTASVIGATRRGT